MFDALNIAASGFDAAGAFYEAAAENLANIPTPGYQPQTVGLIETPGPGGTDGLEIIEVAAAPPLPQPQPGENPGNADSITAAIQLRRAQVLYAANAQVIQSQQQMFGNLINLLDTSQTEPPEEDSDSVL